mgnify:CR=1 FL=1|jgi:hypothetical protein
MATKKQLNDATFFLVAVPKGSGETYPPPTYPPSERVFYISSESGKILLTETGNALVTERSAT